MNGFAITPEHKEWLRNLKVGDVVTRYLAGTIPMDLNVIGLTDDVVDCGWTFCRHTGAEIDEDFNWGPPPKMTGSFIVPVGTKLKETDDKGTTSKT